jgi:hypothetical protein
VNNLASTRNMQNRGSGSLNYQELYIKYERIMLPRTLYYSQRLADKKAAQEWLDEDPFESAVADNQYIIIIISLTPIAPVACGTSKSLSPYSKPC